MHGLRVVLLFVPVVILAGCQSSGKYLPPKQQPITIPPPSVSTTPSGSGSSPSLSSSQGMSRGSTPVDRTVIPVKNTTSTNSLSLPPVSVNVPNKSIEITPVQPVINQVIQPVNGQTTANSSPAVLPTIDPAKISPPKEMHLPIPNMSQDKSLDLRDKSLDLRDKSLIVPPSIGNKEVQFEKPPMPD